MPISIALVDDHRLLLNSLSKYLSDSNTYTISCHTNLASLLGAYQENIPDLIISDLSMPGLSECELIEQMRFHFSTVPILVLSMSGDSKLIKKLFAKGIKGFVSKSQEIEILTYAIKELLRGRKFIDSETERTLKVNQQVEVSLTSREKQILDLLALEKNSDQIAFELGLSIHTVKSFRKLLHAKFGVSKTVGLLMRAKELNLI